MSTFRGQLKWWDGAQWRPNFVVNGVAEPQPASPLINTTTSISTSTTRIEPSTNFTVSGTVTPVPTGGTITLYRNGSSYATGIAVNTSTGAWSKTNAQVTADSTFYAVYQASGSYKTSTSSTKSVAVKVLTTYVKTYACNGTGSYSASGSKRGSTPIYQGYYDGTWGIQRSMITFPTTIDADLAGAVDITKLEVYLNALHWGPGNGGTARIRTHSNTSVPSTWSGVDYSSGYVDVSWSTKTGAKWCNLTEATSWLTPGEWSGTPTRRGIALYYGATDTEYYGYFAGNGETGEPQLRITYRKYV